MPAGKTSWARTPIGQRSRTTLVAQRARGANGRESKNASCTASRRTPWPSQRRVAPRVVARSGGGVRRTIGCMKKQTPAEGPNANVEGEVDASSGVSTDVPAGLMSAEEAARLTGRDPRTIRRWTRRGVLTPVVVKGRVRLLREQVRMIVEQRTRTTLSADESPLSSALDDGELAAEIFEAFDQGADPVTVVKSMKVAPSVVAAHYSQWTHWRGGIFLPEEEFRKLAIAAAVEDIDPSLNLNPKFFIQHLVRTLKHEHQKCEQCRFANATLCAICAREQTIEQANERRSELERSLKRKRELEAVDFSTKIRRTNANRAAPSGIPGGS